MNIKIISTGSYIPESVVTNQDFESILDTNDAWISKRTGIKERRFSNTSTVDMALKASRQALSGIDIDTIDCIIVGTFSADTLVPSVACSVRAQLGITKPIPAFDVNAACSSFIFALQSAHAYIKASIYQRILVIGCDFNTRVLDYTDRSTAILFGDGAGAVVVEGSQEGLTDCILGCETDHDQSIYCPMGIDHVSPLVPRTQNQNQFLTMKGNTVFKFAVNILEQSIRKILERNQLSIDDIDAVISHQANQRILDAGARALNCPSEKFLSNIEYLGNTSSASIPILLDQAYRSGKLNQHATIILVAFGGGLSYGCMVLKG